MGVVEEATCLALALLGLALAGLAAVAGGLAAVGSVLGDVDGGEHSENVSY